MDRIDVLGDSNERLELFTKELLAETNDSELQEIVKQAAVELDSPIALVSLVLDHVQFFKAHIGLPPVLAAARGTHRDVSFCQFVVRDGETFEVNDASRDTRIPQHVVKEYNIQAYLGVPIMVKGTVMGSLCVLDTKKRGFTKEEHSSLNKLAQLVNDRLEAITKIRRQSRLELTELTLKPAIAELSNSLELIKGFINSGFSMGKSIQTFLNHSNYLHSSLSEYSDAVKLSFEAAMKANQLNEELLLEMEYSVKDCTDCINALERIVLNSETNLLSEIIVAAQDLSRNATKLVGGFSLPDFKSDPLIHTKGSLAIAIVTNCLLIISSELGKTDTKNGISLNLNEHAESIELIFSAKDLSKKSIEAATNDLIKLIRSQHPTVLIDTVKGAIRIKFKSINKTAVNNTKLN